MLQIPVLLYLLTQALHGVSSMVVAVKWKQDVRYCAKVNDSWAQMGPKLVMSGCLALNS